MNTILITCSKDKAVVQDDNGRFTNRVSNGVLVEVGDTISCEQIAINSVGVGSDIVEIPRELGDYDYYTNETKLKGAFYIHHNFEFTLQQPFIQYGEPFVTPPDPTIVPFNQIQGLQTATPPAPIPNQVNYGYLTGPGFTNGAPSKDYQKLHTTTLKKYSDVVAGKRFYFISPKGNAYSDNSLPDPDNALAGISSVRPTFALYDFIDTTINLSVDVGYDSPSNIAGKLTEDLHSTLLHPLDTPYDKQIQINDAPFEEVNQLYTDKEFQSVSSVDGTIAVIGANFIRRIPPENPRHYPPGGGFGIPYGVMGCSAMGNPYLWIWGSRLLQGNLTNFFPSLQFPAINVQNSGEKEWGMGAKNAYLIALQPGALLTDYLKDTYSIYTLYDLPKVTIAGPVIINKFEEGYVLMTNLNWTTPNVEYLSKLIHSQMNYIGEGARTKEMSDANERINWEYMLPFGRTADNTIYSATANTALKPLLQGNTITPMGGPADACLSIPVAGFYNDAMYAKAYLDTLGIADGCVIANAQTIKPVQNQDRTRDLDPQTAAKYYDINVVAVTNNKQNLQTANPLLYNPETYIGIICKEYNPDADQIARYTAGTLPLCEKANYCILDLSARNPIDPFITIINPNLRATEASGEVPPFVADVITPAVPEFTTSTPQPDLVTSQPDLVTPQPDLVTPQPNLVTPQPDLITPQPDLVTPQPDLMVPQPDIYTPEVPEVPPSLINYNSTNSGTITNLTATYDYNASPANRVLGNSYETMADDGGLGSDYSTSHSRCITYDAGAGNKIMINPVNFLTEHSSFSMYDRIGITCANASSLLSNSSSNLSSADSTLSQYLYQSSSSSPSTFWGPSWTASNPPYGNGGGWLFPSSSGTDSKGNNNSGWINQWYIIDARYIKIFFKSDGSATEPGWNFRIARQINTPGTPAVPGFYTPQPDLAVPQPDLVTPQPDLVTPQPDIVTPQPDLVTPQPDLVTSQPDIVTPQPNIDVVTPAVPEQTILGTNDRPDYVNTIQIGTPNASLQFDSGRGRFNFQELHWERFIGNPRITTASIKINDDADVVINALNKEIKLFDNIEPLQKVTTIDLVCANSGLGLIDVGLIRKNGNENQIDFLTDLRDNTKQKFWSESLLSRLGFDYKALFNPYGLPDAWFLTRTYQSTSKTKLVQYFPYPLTTNSVLDTSLALDYDQNQTPLEPQPMFNLSSQCGRWNVNASTGTCAIFASNLPQKLVYPFWLIYSDIIGGITFHSSQNGAESNIIAICNRSYVSGDFAYSFATDYVFTATKEFVITGITSQVLNPDLTPATINDRTTIIYKIQKPIKMFQQQQPPPEDKEAKLKQRSGR